MSFNSWVLDGNKRAFGVLRLGDLKVDAEATAASAGAIGKSPSLLGRAGKAISSVFKLSGDTTSTSERIAPASARQPPNSSKTPANSTEFPEPRVGDIVDTIFGPAAITAVRGGESRPVSPSTSKTARAGSGPTPTRAGGATGGASPVGAGGQKGATPAPGTREPSRLQHQKSDPVNPPLQDNYQDTECPMFATRLPPVLAAEPGVADQAPPSSFATTPSVLPLPPILIPPLTTTRPPLGTPPPGGGFRRVRPASSADSLSGERAAGEGEGRYRTPPSSIDELGASMTISGDSPALGGERLFLPPSNDAAAPGAPATGTAGRGNSAPPSPAGTLSGGRGRRRGARTKSWLGSAFSDHVASRGKRGFDGISSDSESDGGTGSPRGTKILECGTDVDGGGKGGKGKKRGAGDGGRDDVKDREVMFEVRREKDECV